MKAKDYSGDTPAEKWSLATQGQRQAWLAEARMPNSVAYSKWASMPPSNRAKLAGIIGGAIGDSITTDKRAQLHRALDHVLDSRRVKDAKKKPYWGPWPSTKPQPPAKDHVLDSRKGRARDIDRWKSEEEISKTLSERQLMQAYADCFKDDPFNKGLNDDDAFKLMRRRLVGRAKDAKGEWEDHGTGWSYKINGTAEGVVRSGAPSCAYLALISGARMNFGSLPAAKKWVEAQLG